MLLKALPVGIESFEEMITGEYYFVDKSLLIKDVLMYSGKVKLITRPRRFGKTLNMDMIKHFYAVDGKDLFEGLKIWEEKAFVKEHYHKYPVVFVTFRDVKQNNWHGAQTKLKEILALLMEDVLKEVGSVSGVVGRIVNEILEKGEMTSYEKSLELMTRMLYEKYGKRVILLIDEYDVPIETAYIYSDKDPEYYDNMVSFMRNLLTAALKGNPYLEFAVITGVYRVAKESLFSSLNNVAVYSILEYDIADKFGFLEDEVYELLKYYGFESDMKAVRDWYNGYIFGKTEGIYNPWSVIWYAKARLSGKSIEQSLQPYWINSSGNDLIIKQIETNPDLQDELDRLLSGQKVTVEIDPFLSLREMETYSSGVWTLLVNGGYLNAYYAGNDLYNVKLPNKEVEKFFRKSVANWIEKKTNVKAIKMLRALSKALNGKVDEFIELLRKYLENSLSYFDVGYDDAERVYKAFVLGMLSMTTNGYIVETETESGYGRVDVAVYPKEKRLGKYALVMELKKAESEEKLEAAARQALEQIGEKGYTAKYEKMGYETIALGMAFYGKKVKVIRG